MSKEKQIEEMAKVLRKGTICYNCRSSINGNERRDWGCHRPSNLDCRYDEDILKACEALYNAGYRKQSEGEWIDANPNGAVYKFTCTLCKETKLGKGTPYCPNCGAKMKGGGE